MNPLLDKDFLLQLDNTPTRELYGRITLLDFEENPIETVTGKIVSGNINVDGKSACRRTCSLALAAGAFSISNYKWVLNSKFKLEVGVFNNTINQYYPDITWFPQGIYLISSFNYNLSTTGTSINIQGKDKMALLNGEVGGITPSLTWDFGSIDVTNEEGTVVNEKYKIKNIVRELVHEFAHEPHANIIVNNLDEEALELLDNKSNIPYYFLYDCGTRVVTQFTSRGQALGFYNAETNEGIALDSIEVYGDRYDLSDIDAKATKIYTYSTNDAGEQVKRYYYCFKINPGETIGYRLTDLVYNGDLISTLGEPVTNILDKIISFLGDYEYFYNIDGQFVFQRKKFSVNKSWNPLKEDGSFDYEDTEYEYIFDNNNLVTSFNNTPNLANIKNDFICWGERNGANNVVIPIHYRYAIDKKPDYYKAFDGTIYTTDEYDWRELIYRMALDYRRYNHDVDNPDDTIPASSKSYGVQLAENNRSQGLYQNGHTGYEQYYVDLEGFWRTLYDPHDVGTFSGFAIIGDNDNQKNAYFNENKEKLWRFVDAAKPDEQIPTTTPPEMTYLDVDYFNKNTLKYIGEMTNEKYAKNWRNYCYPISVAEETYSTEYMYYTKSFNFIQDPEHEFYRWTTKMIDNQESLVFYFDFLDLNSENNSELGELSVSSIGLRTQTENNQKLKALVYKDVPNVIFTTDKEHFVEDIKEHSGYTLFYIDEEQLSNFKLSYQGRSVKEQINTMVYNYGCCTENISISCLPIYYLNPNTKILINDYENGISGEYIISNFSIPLAYNGIMNISASKYIEPII